VPASTSTLVLTASNLAAEDSKLAEKLSGDPMRELVASVAGPREWGDTRESWLSRAARRAGVSYRQAKALFYGEITDADHKTARRMREAAGRHEAAQLAQRFEALAGSLQSRDADLRCSDVAALLHAARALRDLDRSGNSGGEQG
jgi:hypothetical protein